MISKTCCFTGHRDLSGEETGTVRVRLERALLHLISQGVRFFAAGGALGFDTLAAQMVLNLKAEYPHIRLILVLPCRDQADGWREEDRAVYDRIKQGADKVM